MTGISEDSRGAAVPAFRWKSPQQVSVGASSAQNGTAFASTTTHLRIVPTTDCWYLIGSNPTASSSDGFFLPANVVEIIEIRSGEKIAVIQDASSGTLSIGEAT